MRKLLLLAALAALAALAGPAPAQAVYYDMTASEEAPECSLFIKYTQPPPTPDAQFSFEEANAGEWCGRAVLHWLDDTGRTKIAVGEYNDAELTAARCGAQIILNHANEQTPVADILAAEFDKSCGEPATM